MALLGSEKLRQMESELCNAHFSFSQEDYWTEDKLRRYTENHERLQSAFAIIAKERGAAGVLHRLQLVQYCCPAVSKSIARLLSRTTY